MNEDGPPVRVTIGATSSEDEDDLDYVRQKTHDWLLDDLAGRRHGPVYWCHFDAATGLRVLDDYLDPEREWTETRAWLRDHPGGVLVVATADVYDA